MIQTKTCITVYSNKKLWTNFCIVIGAFEDFADAEEIVQKAYDDWCKLSDAQSYPIANWISKRLTENGIEYEIYFKSQDKVDGL